MTEKPSTRAIAASSSVKPQAHHGPREQWASSPATCSSRLSGAQGTRTPRWCARSASRRSVPRGADRCGFLPGLWCVDGPCRCWRGRPSPTTAATLHLLRRLLFEAGKLGAVDLASASLVQHLGGAVTERFATSTADALYAAYRMARLGIIVMDLCRPLAWDADEVPNVGSLVSGVLRRRIDAPDAVALGADRAGASGETPPRPPAASLCIQGRGNAYRRWKNAVQCIGRSDKQKRNTVRDGIPWTLMQTGYAAISAPSMLRSRRLLRNSATALLRHAPSASSTAIPPRGSPTSRRTQWYSRSRLATCRIWLAFVPAIAYRSFPSVPALAGRPRGCLPAGRGVDRFPRHEQRAGGKRGGSGLRGQAGITASGFGACAAKACSSRSIPVPTPRSGEWRRRVAPAPMRCATAR